MYLSELYYLGKPNARLPNPHGLGRIWPEMSFGAGLQGLLIRC